MSEALGTAPGAELVRWSPEAAGRELPAGLDVATAHLVDVSGEPQEWTIRCFWLDADDPEGTLGAGTALRPCAVVVGCERCARGLAELPPEGAEYLAHDERHVVTGVPLAGYRLFPDVCGLTQSLNADDLGASWLGELRQAYGPGLYLVHPAVAGDGSLIGVDPVRVVE